MNVHVHIERVVLDYPATARERTMLQQSLAEELQLLIEQRGLSPALLSGGAIDRVRGGCLPATTDHGDNRSGDLAAAIFQGIAPGESSG